MRMNTKIQLLLLGTSLLACQVKVSNDVTKKSYSHDVGDILFDSRYDDSHFTMCDSSKISTSRSGLVYASNDGSVLAACKELFEFQPAFETYSGFVTIRFIVNCHNQADRFRAQPMDFDFSEKECPLQLINHLLGVARGLNHWRPSSERHASLDHAKYLNFKIKEGRIQNVLQ